MSKDKKLMVWNWRFAILKEGPKNKNCRLLLLTLSCYMNSAGESCFPSIDELQNSTCMARATVVKYLRQAEAEGWIKISKKPTGHAWNRNEYFADIPENAVHSLNRVWTERSSIQSERSSNQTLNAVHGLNSNSPYNSPKNSPEREGSLSGERFSERVEKANSTPGLLGLFKEYLTARGRPVTEHQIEVLKSTCQGRSVDQVRAAVFYTVENGWKRLTFPDEDRFKNHPHPDPNSVIDPADKDQRHLDHQAYKNVVT